MATLKDSEFILIPDIDENILKETVFMLLR